MAETNNFREQIHSIQNGRLDKELTFFISDEREQKFDLLVHLVTNLNKPLIICGPNGIGKTTLLTQFQLLKSSIWPVLYLTASDQLSFEAIQQKIWRFLLQEMKDTVEAQSLNQMLQDMEELNQRLVLIIDDAGKLMSGLMTSLMQYTARYPSLRIVFALNNDELKIKSSLDQSLGTCHFIEIPPLSLLQCRDYVQNLVTGSSKLGADFGGKVVSDSRINEVTMTQIYKNTQGIPGKIVQELPTLLSANAMKGSTWIYILVIASVVTIGVGAFLWRIDHVDAEKVAQSSGGTSGVQVSALTIPGQTVPDPVVAETKALIDGAKKTKPVPELSELNASKPDYYTGYSRAREKDALDEYQANKESGLTSELATEQPKVEIIPPEPPPEPIAPVQQAPVVAEPVVAETEQAKAELPVHSDTKLKSEINATLEPKTSPKIKLVESGDAMAHLESKEKVQLIKEKPVVKVVKKPPLPSVPKNVKEPESVKSPPQEIKMANVSKPKVEEVKVADVKVVPVEKRAAQNVKTSGETLAKLDNVEKIKTAPPAEGAKAELSEPKKDNLPKAEPSKSVNPAVGESVLEQTVKPIKQVTPQQASEPTGLARLGVVMKYKSDIVKPIKAPPENPVSAPASASVEKSKEPVKTEPAVVSQAPVPGGYTLQVMVFTQQQTLQGFMQKHSALAGNLRHVTINKDGLEKYVVMYGSFGSIAEANAAKQKLPGDFKQAYARKK